LEFDISALKEEIIEMPQLHDAVTALRGREMHRTFFDPGNPDLWH
jgi:hypothetical protein